MILLHSQVGQDLWGAYTLEILLWLLGAFLLGYLLRYWIGAKWRNRVAELEKDLDEWKARANQFEADLSAAKYDKDKIAEELARAKSKLADVEIKLKACEERNASDGSYSDSIDAGDGSHGNVKNVAAAGLGFASGNISAGNAPSGLSTAFTSDNLQVVEGVGPKIENLLKNGGINTWGELAGSSNDNLTGILVAAGSRYKMHDPKTWPEQANLANEGKWDELINYQKNLDRGKDIGNVAEAPSKVEKMYMKAHGLKSFSSDDLKVVEGIGPKIEQLLKNGGINNWTELANSEVSKIKGILNNAGDRYRLADPGTWAKQARMAVAGNWSKLKEYQDYLQGGKE